MLARNWWRLLSTPDRAALCAVGWSGSPSAAVSVRGGVEAGVPDACSVRGGVEAGVPDARSLRVVEEPAQTPQSGRRVAITIDDGPVVGEMKDLANFQRFSAGLIGSLQAGKVPATIFINERQLNVPGQRDARVAALRHGSMRASILATTPIRIRTLNNVPLWQFGDDVVKGEVIMRPLIEQRGRTLVWFRYPFLHSGTTAEIHQGIMDFLEQRNYRVAPVTVDYADYTFAGVYRSQRLAGKADVAEKSRMRISSRSASGSSTRRKPRWNCSATKSRRFC